MISNEHDTDHDVERILVDCTGRLAKLIFRYCIGLL